MERRKIIRFKDIKDRIMSELEKRMDKTGISEKITLINGFLNEPFSKELSDALVVGGPKVPMVILVGNESGRIYLFALRELIDDLDTYMINEEEK